MPKRTAENDLGMRAPPFAAIGQQKPSFIARGDALETRQKKGRDGPSIENAIPL
jgi:hypothetical protein